MAITGASNTVPAPLRQLLATNYVDFLADGNGWAQQYLPDLMAEEAEVFGNRTISGFLSQVGAEEAMTADQVVWSEQGRLHLSYTGVTTSTAGGGTIEITKDCDALDIAAGKHGIRIGDMVLMSDTNSTVRGYVTVADDIDATVTIKTYNGKTFVNAGFADSAGANTVTVLVFGSEYAKGQIGRVGAVKPGFKSFSNKPIIIKDKYEISGSDASQIGWVEVSGEEGQNGYLWYLKAEGDTRARFSDYLEMAMIESEKSVEVSSANGVQTALGQDSAGTEGLFSALEARGNATSGITGVNAATDLAEFDSMLAEFDKNGSIEENMMFVNRATSLAMDDMLASMNSYGAGGTSYGVFDNSEDMALNLGFSGFRRGSYDFYKSDWKYLNDKATRGGLKDNVGNIRGVVIPAGVSSVYDQSLGKNLKRPFLHVRYRASQTDNRKLKTWTTGSVGAATSDLDAMEVHYLSERCLVVQGANNFMLMS